MGMTEPQLGLKESGGNHSGERTVQGGIQSVKNSSWE